jgi:hypothetical protein
MGEGASGRAKAMAVGVQAARCGRSYLPLVVGLAIALGALNSGSAWAAPIVELKVAFSPDRLGTSTTIKTDIHVRPTTGLIPPPMLSIDLALPAGMGLATTELGLNTCSEDVLEVIGVIGCPRDAVMGFGEATADAVFASEIIPEKGTITILMGKPVDEHTSLLFYVDGATPISSQGIFPTVLLPSESADSAAQLDTTVPLTPTVPGAEDLSVVDVRTSFGPEGLTYIRHVHGRTVAFTPKGFVTPTQCPKGGFPFRGTFTFLGGSVVSSRAAVPCPRGGKRP